MLMLSGFFLTKEPHIHTLVESWTWSWDCWTWTDRVGNTLSKRHSDSTKKACGKLVNVFNLSKASSWNWENLWAEARRAWQPPGMLPTSPGQDLPEAAGCSFWSGDGFDSYTCSGVSSISRYLPAPHSLDHQNTLADLRPDQGLNFLMLQQSKQLPCKILRPWWPCSSSLQFVDLFWPPLLLGASVSGASNEAVE